MTLGLGIALAFVAMLCWGFGDFLLQKSARRLGDWETLFIIASFGAIVLTPFVWKEIPDLFADSVSLNLLLLASAVLFVAALLDLEALRKGKLAIVEPIWSFEIVAASLLSLFVLKEHVTILQIVLIVCLMCGLILVAFKNVRFSRSILLEKGIFIALIAALTMGTAGFLMGLAGRVSDPLMTNFFTDTFLAVFSGIYLALRGRFLRVFKDLKNGYAFLLPMSVSDKVAWLAYVFSMSVVPIAVATALSESYIIIAVLLGLFVNHEKLHRHQKIGLIAALVSAIVLAGVSSG